MDRERAIAIRVLTRADAGAYQRLRLRALREHPEAYGSSYEEERGKTLRDVADRIAPPPERGFTLGAAVDGVLSGVVSVIRMPQSKTRHRAILVAMYVVPESRGAGVGRALLHAAIARSHAIRGIEDLYLAVTVGNDVARSLYLSAGFVPFGVESRALKIGDRCYDLEWMALRLRDSWVTRS
jgi:GNAT superfamily N-acetyltransferase